MTETLHIITCSYGLDFERCRRLCNSVDRFVPERIRHTLIVPKRDLDTFAPLANHRREIRSTESVLPARYRQMPGMQRWWLDDQGWPVRGWVLQQLTKMSADRVTDAENLLIADSDIQFIRAFDENAVLKNGQLRLHRIPEAKQSGIHLTWHEQAGALLGTPRAYAGADYVGQLITWRRQHLLGMKERIASVTGRPWHRAVGRSLRVSEYILYGVYVDGVVRSADYQHFRSDEDLCHCCWFDQDAVALERGVHRIGSRSVALLLQSNIGLDTRQEDALVDLALAQAQQS